MKMAARIRLDAAGLLSKRRGRMRRKIVAVFTLWAFSLFSISCAYRIQQKNSSYVARSGPGTKILAVQTKAREYIEFGEKRAAQLKHKAVVGEGLTTVAFNREDVVLEVAPSPTAPGEIDTKDGKHYRVLTLRSDGEKLICQAYVPVSIPVSEIQLAWVKTLNTGKTILQGLGVLLVIGLVIALLALDEETGTDFADGLFEGGPESDAVPPSVYQDFWESYFLDAELHGAAPGQGFKIREWTAVDFTQLAGGRDKFLFSNELTEPKSTDELKIVIVDYPDGSIVVPDFEGTMRTVSAPVKPQKAYDQHKKDILPLIEKKDGLFWTSPDDEKDTKKKEDLRDELVFELPKPKEKGVKQAKLIVNATNTMWASHFAGRFLGIPGVSPVKTSDPGKTDMSGGRARDWYREEEFYKLRVWVETKNGWQPRQTIYGGGPFAPRDKVSVLDIGDASGPTLKIKLMPPANFWMIDRLAVDYSKDLPIEVNEVNPESAAAPGISSEDVLAALAEVDGRYLDLPSSIDKVEMTFVSPPLKPGLQRSVFARTVSRYEIRPSPDRRMPAAIALRMTWEPGFAARYALEGYLRWEAKLRAKLGKAGVISGD
jgi:hypothetical protein